MITLFSNQNDDDFIVRSCLEILGDEKDSEAKENDDEAANVMCLDPVAAKAGCEGQDNVCGKVMKCENDLEVDDGDKDLGSLFKGSQEEDKKTEEEGEKRRKTMVNVLLEISLVELSVTVYFLS